MGKKVLAAAGMLLGIVAVSAASGGAIGYLSGSWDFLSPEGYSGENPLYMALTVGFALSAGLAVYSLFGWRHDRKRCKHQSQLFQEIKALVDQERDSFNAVAKVWEQKERGWQDEKERWHKERDHWYQQREAWTLQKDELTRELGKKQQALGTWAEKEKLWEEEKNRFKQLTGLWEQTRKSWESEKQALDRSRQKDGSAQQSMTEEISSLKAALATAEGAAEEANSLKQQAMEDLATAGEKAEARFKDRLDGFKAQLTEARENRLAFLSRISGALRAPAGRMAQLAKTGRDQPEETLTQIATLAESFTAKLDSVLDMARLQTGDYGLVVSETRLEKVLSRVAGEWTHKAKSRDITLVWPQSGEDLGKLSVDERLLEKCIRSLVDNAVKFTERAGRVTLTGCVQGNDGERQAVIEVKDTGIGISDQERDRIFEPFVHDVQQRHELTEEGAGLGLSLIKGFIDIHGGDITVTSHPGEGSTFVLTFNERSGQADEAGSQDSACREQKETACPS